MPERKGKAPLKSGGKLGTNRSPREREMDRLEMVKLLRRGYTQQEVADIIGISQAQVCYDWKIVISKLRNESDTARDELIAIKLEEYREIKREAWDAWERSKEDAERLEEDEFCEDRTCAVCSGKGTNGRGGKCFNCQGNGFRKAQKATSKRLTREGKNPANEYLRTILSCVEAERELLGINPDKKVSGTLNVMNWDLLANGIPDGQVPDLIEQEIAKAVGYNPETDIIHTCPPIKEVKAIESNGSLPSACDSDSSYVHDSSSNGNPVHGNTTDHIEDGNGSNIEDVEIIVEECNGDTHRLDITDVEDIRDTEDI
jgi:predicted transcriptional regulator